MNNTTRRNNMNNVSMNNRVNNKNNANKIATLEKKLNKLTNLIKPVANHVKPVPKAGTFIKVPLNEQTIEFLQNMNTVPNSMRNTQFVFGNHGSKHGRGFYSTKNFLPKNINTNYNKNKVPQNNIMIIPNNNTQRVRNNNNNNNMRTRNNNNNNMRIRNNNNMRIRNNNNMRIRNNTQQNGIIILPNNKKQNQVITF